MKPPILITGAARSGTSMCAGVIELCGAWGGETYGPNRFNKKGMFENKDIRDRLVKPLLLKWGYDPMGQDPLPDVARVHELATPEEAETLRNKIHSTIRRQGYEDRPWYYKGAKMTLLWPLWHAAFPDAEWIIVRRMPEDIVASCMRTAFMRAYRRRSGWLMWVAHHEECFEQMHDAKLRIHEVWPERAIKGDLTELQMVVNALGLEWKFDRVREFIAPSLWHRAKSEGA